MSKRLRHRLELQAGGIEDVFARFQIPAHVTGGSIANGSTQYLVAARLAPDWERAPELADELVQTLGVKQVHLQTEPDKVLVEVVQLDPPPVTLLDILETAPPLAPATAVLGRPSASKELLILDFRQPQMGHVLVTGGPGAGKTALMRTIALSAAITQRQSRVQMLFIDLDVPGREARDGGDLLQPLDYLPHALSATITRAEDVEEVIQFIQGEIGYRQRQHSPWPHILVFVEHLALLLDACPGAHRALQQILQHGAGAGIHLICSTRSPHGPELNRLLRAQWPAQLTGRQADELAPALADSGFLRGRGDFLAVFGKEQPLRFQAAYADGYDLQLCLDELYSHLQPVLVARELEQLKQDVPETSPSFAANQQDFVLDGRRVILS